MTNVLGASKTKTSIESLGLYYPVIKSVTTIAGVQTASQMDSKMRW